MNKNKYNIGRLLLITLLSVLMTTLSVTMTVATPVAINITSNTSSSATGNTYSRADDGGTITTLGVNVSQQTDAWKGYVGNVTGKLALRDSSNYTLYDWVLSSISGEVYASRSNSITWSTLNCSTVPNLVSEYAAVNMVDTDADSINKTFNFSGHSAITVAGRTIAADTCNSTATYINSTAQTVSSSAKFQEVLLDDTTNIVYATILNQATGGYRNGYTYDFQMIIPDTDAASAQTTYYFWAELN